MAIAMVTSGGSVRIEGGNQILSAGVRKTIQTIKEIVGNHTDADIYVALKDSNMDPNETAQKLLNQGQFLLVQKFDLSKSGCFLLARVGLFCRAVHN